MEISSIILSNILKNEIYVRQVLPFLKSDYFERREEQIIFNAFSNYFSSSNRLPEKSILTVTVENAVGGSIAESAIALLNECYDIEAIQDTKWLFDNTEEFCRSRAMFNAITQAISIYDGTEKKLTPHCIPDLVKDALSVSFNTDIGMDWFDDAEKRFESYCTLEHKIPFHLNTFNDITNGGVNRKTLNILLGGVHVGKTLSLINLGIGYIKQGFNVLYVSLEMAPEEILLRVDANLIDLPMHEFNKYGTSNLVSKFNSIKTKGYGKFKTVQYPTSSAHTGHIKTLLEEFKMKQAWKPDIVIVDYLGILASSRVKFGSVNSHFYLKAVAEELRALAIEYDIAVWSAHQLTREGMTSSDPDMTDTAESIGITNTVDLIVALTRTDETDHLNQLICKQLKNRYKSKNYKTRFIIGCNFDRQQFYDLEDSLEGVTNESSKYKDKKEVRYDVEDDCLISDTLRKKKKQKGSFADFDLE